MRDNIRNENLHSTSLAFKASFKLTFIYFPTKYFWVLQGFTFVLIHLQRYDSLFLLEFKFEISILSQMNKVDNRHDVKAYSFRHQLPHIQVPFLS